MTKQTYEDDSTVTYEYDNSGALATVTDSASGISTTYYYDFTDRLMKYVESGTGYSHSVGYAYDDIKNLTALVETINGVAHTTLGTRNPLRYRGYVYDTETGLYYLQSRYYNPEWGRFINADALVATGQGLLGNNMFAYCNNNPISFIDPCGSCIHRWYFLGIGDCPACQSQKLAWDKWSIYFDLPLYSQGNTNLCWAYCQLMIEDYWKSQERTRGKIDKAAKQLAVEENGTDNWNSGDWPQNRGGRILADSIDDITDLYILLVCNGPFYACYSNGRSSHLVVVTGVNISKGLVFTNNPNGTKGIQTFDEFLAGYALPSGAQRQEMPLSSIYLVDIEEGYK